MTYGSDSECLPVKYLQNILPSCNVWQSVYYRWHSRSGRPQWCETDGLVLFADHLFILECRGGAFTYTPPASDFPAYIRSLENLVLKPATQGERFLSYLNSSNSVDLFDLNHQKVGEIRKSDFWHITICAITLDQFTELAARVQHLRGLGLDVGDTPVWSISLDDLRTFADVFSNPLVFLHFVEKRLDAFRSTAVECNDELDHLGLYLENSHYVRYAEAQARSGTTKLVFLGYRSGIDRFFAVRLENPDTPCWLIRDLPSHFFEILDFLSDCKQPGRARVASVILDLDDKGLKNLSEHIKLELRQQPKTKQPKSASIYGNANMTLFCWKSPLSNVNPANSGLALQTARLASLPNGKTRLLLELNYRADDTLEAASWQWVNLRHLAIIKCLFYGSVLVRFRYGESLDAVGAGQVHRT